MIEVKINNKKALINLNKITYVEYNESDANGCWINFTDGSAFFIEIDYKTLKELIFKHQSL